ncbi:MAG: GFA family protein [Alphaproteobacteria bacterium]|nr:GFA family protein [Alphaproteobacteria bacterium]
MRFRAEVDLDRLSQCSCSICTKKGILLLSIDPAVFQLLRGRSALTAYTFGTGVAQHTFCSPCGMHAFYIPRSQPHRVTVNARCLDDIDGPSLKPTRFFDGRHWEDAQRRRIEAFGQAPPPDAHGATTLQAILDRALA